MKRSVHGDLSWARGVRVSEILSDQQFGDAMRAFLAASPEARQTAISILTTHRATGKEGECHG